MSLLESILKKVVLEEEIATESKGIGPQWIVICKEGETVYFKWKKWCYLGRYSL